MKRLILVTMLLAGCAAEPIVELVPAPAPAPEELWANVTTVHRLARECPVRTGPNTRAPIMRHDRYRYVLSAGVIIAVQNYRLSKPWQEVLVDGAVGFVDTWCLIRR